MVATESSCRRLTVARNDIWGHDLLLTTRYYKSYLRTRKCFENVLTLALPIQVTCDVPKSFGETIEVQFAAVVEDTTGQASAANDTIPETIVEVLANSTNKHGNVT